MTFLDYLEGEFVKDYAGIKDDANDSFDNWLGYLEFDDYETYAERYAAAEVALALEAARLAKTND